MTPQRQSIARSEFERIGRPPYFCQTLSWGQWPNPPVRTSVFDVPLEDFFEAQTYPTWYVDVAASRFIDEGVDCASPIRFKDLVLNNALVREQLTKWRHADTGPLGLISIVSLHCQGCERWAVIDGNHGLTWAGAKRWSNAVVHVTECSGPSWPPNTHDMRRVCECLNHDARNSR